MSRKHFIALAKALAESKDDIERPAFVRLVDDVAAVCATTNSNFDHARFRAACEGR